MLDKTKVARRGNAQLALNLAFLLFLGGLLLSQESFSDLAENRSINGAYAEFGYNSRLTDVLGPRWYLADS